MIIILRVCYSGLSSCQYNANQVALTVDPHFLIRHVRRVQPVCGAITRRWRPARSGPRGVSVLKPTRPGSNDAQVHWHDLTFTHEHNVTRHQRDAASLLALRSYGDHSSYLGRLCHSPPMSTQYDSSFVCTCCLICPCVFVHLYRLPDRSVFSPNNANLFLRWSSLSPFSYAVV